MLGAAGKGCQPAGCGKKPGGSHSPLEDALGTVFPWLGAGRVEET